MKHMKKASFIALATMVASQAAFAQAAGGTSWTGNVNPSAVIWILVEIIGGITTAVAAVALLWTSIQGMISDHDNFQKLPKLVIWGAIAAGATYLARRMSTGA